MVTNKRWTDRITQQSQFGDMDVGPFGTAHYYGRRWTGNGDVRFLNYGQSPLETQRLAQWSVTANGDADILVTINFQEPGARVRLRSGRQTLDGGFRWLTTGFRA